MNIKDFENEPSKHIWGDDCTLHIDSIFQREFTGDLNLLLSCLEDNATPDGLNYYQAIKDYRDVFKSNHKSVKPARRPFGTLAGGSVARR